MQEKDCGWTQRDTSKTCCGELLTPLHSATLLSGRSGPVASSTELEDPAYIKDLQPRNVVHPHQFASACAPDESQASNCEFISPELTGSSCEPRGRGTKSIIAHATHHARTVPAATHCTHSATGCRNGPMRVSRGQSGVRGLLVRAGLLVISAFDRLVASSRPEFRRDGGSKLNGDQPCFGWS